MTASSQAKLIDSENIPSWNYPPSNRKLSRRELAQASTKESASDWSEFSGVVSFPPLQKSNEIQTIKVKHFKHALKLKLN